jgi:hypothetical protein
MVQQILLISVLMSLKKDTDTGTISEKKNCKEKHGNSSMSKGENVYGKL